LLVSIEIVVHVGAALPFSDQFHYAAVPVALPIVRCTQVSAFALPINAAVRSMGGDTAVAEIAIRSGCTIITQGRVLACGYRVEHILNGPWAPFLEGGASLGERF